MNNIEVYTDGSCFKEFSIGGWGVYIIYSNKSIKFSGSCECRSSASVELIAVLKALEYIDYYLENVGVINLYTDCDYIVKLIKEFESKRKFSYRTKTSRRNKHILSLMSHYTELMPIKWHVVKSHKGVKGNEIADSLAKKAARIQIDKKKGSKPPL